MALQTWPGVWGFLSFFAPYFAATPGPLHGIVRIPCYPHCSPPIAFLLAIGAHYPTGAEFPQLPETLPLHPWAPVTPGNLEVLISAHTKEVWGLFHARVWGTPVDTHGMGQKYVPFTISLVHLCRHHHRSGTDP